MSGAPVRSNGPERASVVAKLVAERVRIEQRLAALDRSISELVEDRQTATPDDEHDPDGTTASDRAQLSSLREATRQRLRQVNSALANIDADDFGVCARCRHPIGQERLEALPGVEFCVTCAVAGAGAAST